MHIFINWENPEQTVLRWTFLKGWTWVEYYNQLEISKSYVRSVSHTVDILVDAQNVGLVSSNVLSHVQNALNDAPQNLGAIVVISNNHFLQILCNLLSRIYPIHIHLVSTIDDAYEILANKQTERQIAS